VTVVFISLWNITSLTGAEGVDVLRKAVYEAVEEMIGDVNALYRSRDKLRELPAEEVIPVLVQHLRSDPRFGNVQVRGMGYELLAWHGAETTEVGLEEMLRALPENGGLAKSLSRLGPTPPARVLEAIGKKFVDDLPTPNDEVIKALGSFGTLSRAYLPQIEEVFFNTAFGAGGRGDAADAMIRIAGMKWAVERFEKIDASKDPKGEVVVLGTLGYFGAETNATYDTDNATRDAIRERVLQGTRNEHKEVRKAALEGLLPSFGEDGIVIRSRTDYELHPGIKAALLEMTRRDPDEGLRQRAAKVLEQTESVLDDVVKQIMEQGGPKKR